MLSIRSIFSKSIQTTSLLRGATSTIATTNQQYSLFSTDTGKVKFYIRSKAYGFIISDTDNAEVFVHRTNVAGAPGDDNMNPILLNDEKLKFDRVSGEDGKLIAENVTYEDGSLVPVYREGFLEKRSRGTKTRLGVTVYDILTEGGDEEVMAQKIAEAYTSARDDIAHWEKKTGST
mmetsp:Transcript_24152/g.29738  ORF Transcript_24152/g.29738 Transcript_24152/m.29738 type:complete len:176 (+) Transcript_24152:126-653(+)